MKDKVSRHCLETEYVCHYWTSYAYHPHMLSPLQAAPTAQGDIYSGTNTYPLDVRADNGFNSI